MKSRESPALAIATGRLRPVAICLSAICGCAAAATARKRIASALLAHRTAPRMRLDGIRNAIHRAVKVGHIKFTILVLAERTDREMRRAKWLPVPRSVTLFRRSENRACAAVAGEINPGEARIPRTATPLASGAR